MNTYKIVVTDLTLELPNEGQVYYIEAGSIEDAEVIFRAYNPSFTNEKCCSYKITIT